MRIKRNFQATDVSDDRVRHERGVEFKQRRELVNIRCNASTTSDALCTPSAYLLSEASLAPPAGRAFGGALPRFSRFGIGA